MRRQGYPNCPLGMRVLKGYAISVEGVVLWAGYGRFHPVSDALRGIRKTDDRVPIIGQIEQASLEAWRKNASN